MKIYFARISEHVGEGIILAKNGSIEEEQAGFGSDVAVTAVYAIELDEREERMFELMIGIDRVTNTSAVEDLIAKIFAAGRNSR